MIKLRITTIFGRKHSQDWTASGAVSLYFTGQVTAGFSLIKLHGTYIPVQTGKLSNINLPL